MTPEDILPGSQALLDELRRAGIKTAVASASKRPRCAGQHRAHAGSGRHL
jgi:beta-phosphoglucomutase-like phosphatase (HAD superfamily)